MTKTWLKATLTVQTTTELDEQRKQTFNAIAQDATDEQLAAFGKIVEVLTGALTWPTPTATIHNPSLNTPIIIGGSAHENFRLKL
ncbi:hypothetical protein [Lactiplantibacillus plantarum]|uniref:DUF1659 domain-containing protein n=1 Tax=Lactiplantibacillus plantarum TaxID=1590 RepID=UPI003BA2C33A